MGIVKDIFRTVKRFVIKHLNCFVCGAIALILIIVSLNMTSEVNSKLDVANRQLSDIKNNINNYDLMLQNKEVEVVIDEDNVDFKKSRYDDDISRFTGYLVDCFEFNDADEYNANREVLIKRLGADHSLFKQFLTEYKPEYADQFNEHATIDDGKNFSCHIKPKSFVPTLYKMDPNTGANTYIGTLTCTLIVPESYSGDFIVNGTGISGLTGVGYDLGLIAICTVESTGEISSFEVQAIIEN